MVHSRLAGYGKRGSIWVNKNVPVAYHHIAMKARLLRHEQVERALREKGMSYKCAHRRALKAEERGMTPHQIEVYNGFLGSVARYHPRHYRRKRWLF